MKKSKIVLVVVLALVLCITCITAPTFSWYSRPKEQKGNALTWGKVNPVTYDISTGEGVSIATYASADGKTYGDTAVTDSEFSATLAPGATKYYRTAISNSGNASQSISLYLSQLDLGENLTGNFCLGVNGPLRTYKSYTDYVSASEPVLSDIGLKNVYVGFNTSQTYTPTNYQVHWWVDSNSTDNGDSNVQAYFNPEKTGTYNNGTYKMTYATIPWRADSVKLRQGNTWYGDDNKAVNTYNTIIHYLWDGSYLTGYYASSAAAGINTFYSSASVAAGSTVSIPAVGSGTITYSSSNTAVATVNASGTVTGVSEGTAIITATATGVYGDKLTAECTVSVYQNVTGAFDVPIVTNYKISPVLVDGTASTENVYWYIKNDSDQSLTYIIKGIYVSL